MSQLETAMGMIIAVFDKYAKTDGNSQALTKAELRTLLEKELPNFLSVLGLVDLTQTIITGKVLNQPEAEINPDHRTERLDSVIKSGKDKDAIDKVFKNLDENGDSQVDFKEFVIFVAALTSCCHKYFEQNAAR